MIEHQRGQNPLPRARLHEQRDQRRDMRHGGEPERDAGTPGPRLDPSAIRRGIQVDGFPHESRSVTVRLNTGAPATDSLRSAQK